MDRNLSDKSGNSKVKDLTQNFSLDNTAKLGKYHDVIKILQKNQEPSYRLNQLKSFLFKKYKYRVDDITVFSKQLRDDIKSNIGDTLLNLKLIKTLKTLDSIKLIFIKQSPDNLNGIFPVETVLLKNSYSSNSMSLCVSSQSGCAVKCKFCTTGLLPHVKNLTTKEILDQVIVAGSFSKISSIVIMGMGEPFLNKDNVFNALKILIDKDYFGFSPRRISVSTVGIVPVIYEFTKMFPQVNLAFSLHTPFDTQRYKLIPIAKNYPLVTIFKALDNHIYKTHRKVFLEYIVLKGVNDTTKHIDALIKLIKSRGKNSYLYHVNLIAYNPGPIKRFKRPNKADMLRFVKFLTNAGISSTIRASVGLDNQAACGQLGWHEVKNSE